MRNLAGRGEGAGNGDEDDLLVLELWRRTGISSQLLQTKIAH